MKIITLCENTSINPDLGSEHGLSFYIELDDRKILFDTGASGLFAENAKKLGVDLSAVDIVIISHGHYDHGGGLTRFLEINTKAKIYISRNAFGNYYSDGGNKYIGIDKTLKDNERFIFVDDYQKISDSIQLFSNVQGRELFSTMNKTLLKEKNQLLIEDDFLHEMNAVFFSGDKKVLFAGCAHNGILNILKRYEAIFGGEPDYYIGGLHLSGSSVNVNESDDRIIALSEKINPLKVKVYTCHCTGLYAYGILKGKLGEKINYMATGSSLTI